MATEHRKIEVLGVPFSCCTFEEIIDSIQLGITHDNRGYISITNTESLYHATKIPYHFQYINEADFSCCDGVAIVLAGKMLGYDIPRLHGPDLMSRCCKAGVSRKWRHFFYGGKNGVPEQMDRIFSQKFPNFKAVGTYSPPFRPLTAKEDRAVVERINSTHPDIVWVGLGLLKQEKWISDHFGKIKAPWMIGVGAAFDFHAQTIKRAPKIFQTMGMEWLYRLTFEPRMLIRNLYSLLIFPPVFKEVFKTLRKTN